MTAPNPLFLREEELDRGLDLLLLAGRQLAAEARPLLDAAGLDETDHHLLFLVRRRPGITLVELCEAMGTSKQTLSRHLLRLAELGLVERAAGRRPPPAALHRDPARRGAAGRANAVQKGRLRLAFKSAGAAPVEGFHGAARAGAGAGPRGDPAREGVVTEQTPAHILVVDDDARLRDLLQRYLVNNGYLVSVAGDAEEAKDRLRSLAFDLVVLDVMLPGQDGVAFTGELRRDSDLPILLLTARGEPEHRISGLEAGADDYLSKPFEPRELLLRIGTILRRAQASRSDDDTVRFGPFAFNRATGELKRDDQVVHLTSGEIALLQVLAARPGKAVSRAELSEQGRVAGSDRAVDVQMARLRRKIEDDPRQPRYLLTARGSGYVLRPGS